MRKFFSYGPLNTKYHYHAPRKELLDSVYEHLAGDTPEEGGRYFTIWGPRQTGKTWCMNQVYYRIKEEKTYDVVRMSVGVLENETDSSTILEYIGRTILKKLGKNVIAIDNKPMFEMVFSNEILDKPLILMLDEFDALSEDAIHMLVGVFRDIYIDRYSQTSKKTDEKDYLLHGLVLIGVRRVMGVENKKGSPFNVQRSIKVPNLSFDEVQKMFQRYQTESGQTVESPLIKKLYDETRGQPGLVGWFGEILTQGWEKVTPDKTQPLNPAWFERAYAASLAILPNNNILNIISKARDPRYSDLVIDLFQTGEKIEFAFSDDQHNFLYMNGVIDAEISAKDGHETYYIKFSCPFVQNTLFRAFSKDIFGYMGQLIDPFVDIKSVFTKTHLDLDTVFQWYQLYLQKNGQWLFKDVPRRVDLQICEAVFHFNLYMFLHNLISQRGGQVLPEFPAGNGQIDLIVRYKKQISGVELKSFSDLASYDIALEQAARYGHRLNLKEIILIFFIPKIDAAHRQKLEKPHTDPSTGVLVKPTFIEAG